MVILNVLLVKSDGVSVGRNVLVRKKTVWVVMRERVWQVQIQLA